MKIHIERIVAVLVLLSATLSFAEIVAGPITNSANGHLYYLTSRTNWVSAEAEAVSLGGHLVAINDTDEQEWVYSTFAPLIGSVSIWIGLSDQDIEGTFQWANGDITSYRNWAPYEPNNYQFIDQDYAHLYPSTDESAGKWNDKEDSFALSFFGVAEVIQGISTQATINTAVEVSWESLTTNSYQIQWSSARSPNAWFNVGDPLQGTGGTLNQLISTKNKQAEFYRVLSIEP